ncbi:MAG: transcriptional regulator, partial [Geminicoccaceae bacterium]
MESARPSRAPAPHSLEVRLLGPLTIRRDGTALALPASRKVRALLAYLTLAPHAVARGDLCDLLWDGPSDPRGELRWSLSKIRGLLDEPGRGRVDAGADAVRLDLGGCFVDVLEIDAVGESVATLPIGRLRALVALFGGDFAQRLEVERSPTFTGWVTAQRRRFRACHIAMLERLTGDAPEGDGSIFLERWLELAPFDLRAHEHLLGALARSGRIREGEEHLAASVRSFEAEGLDGGPLRAAWRKARSLPQAVSRITGGGAVSAERSEPVAPARRASIAVMPFVDRSGDAEDRGGLADAFAHDVITRLAKLRVLFVIAQGTVFALDER